MTATEARQLAEDGLVSARLNNQKALIHTIRDLAERGHTKMWVNQLGPYGHVRMLPTNLDWLIDLGYKYTARATEDLSYLQPGTIEW